MLPLSWQYSARPYFWGANEHAVGPHHQLSFPAGPRPDIPFSFCEEKYHVHPFIAEFANTITNLCYILLAIHGYRRSRSSWRLYLAFALVGCASFYNHMTLRYRAQLADQISMHLLSSLLFYSSIVALIPRSKRGPSALIRPLLALTLILLESMMLFFIITGHKAGLHQESFAAMCLMMALVLCYRVERGEGKEIKGRLRRLEVLGVLTFLVGYGFWKLDFDACGVLREWRREVGVPYGMLLELHGWWHVLTAISGSCYIEVIERLRTRSESQAPYLPTIRVYGPEKIPVGRF